MGAWEHGRGGARQARTVWNADTCSTAALLSSGLSAPFPLLPAWTPASPPKLHFPPSADLLPGNVRQGGMHSALDDNKIEKGEVVGGEETKR